MHFALWFPTTLRGGDERQRQGQIRLQREYMKMLRRALTPSVIYLHGDGCSLKRQSITLIPTIIIANWKHIVRINSQLILPVTLRRFWSPEGLKGGGNRRESCHLHGRRRRLRGWNKRLSKEVGSFQIALCSETTAQVPLIPSLEKRFIIFHAATTEASQN